MMLRIIVTLTFDSSPIKGEREYVVALACCLPAPAPPLWIADQVRNDVTMRCMSCSPPCGYCLKASMTDPDRHSRVGGNPQGGE